MNKLITTYNGGMPDHLDNFRWYEDGIMQALDSICKGLSGAVTGLRLWGAEVTETAAQYQISEGAIYMKGEVFKVPAHTLQKFATGTTGTYFWDIEISYDPAGQLNFENAQQYNVYQIRVAKLTKVTQALPAGSFVERLCPRMQDVWTLKSLYNTLQTNFTNLQNGYNDLRSKVGTAYYFKQVPQAPLAYETPRDITWGTKAGLLAPAAGDLVLQDGGIYLVRVLQGGNNNGLRIKSGSSFNKALVQGDNIIKPGFLFGTSMTATFQYQTDATFEIYVQLLAVVPLTFTDIGNGNGGGTIGVIIP